MELEFEKIKERAILQNNVPGIPVFLSKIKPISYTPEDFIGGEMLCSL